MGSLTLPGNKQHKQGASRVRADGRAQLSTADGTVHGVGVLAVQCCSRAAGDFTIQVAEHGAGANALREFAST